MITVFFTLLTIVFLGLMFALTESVRISGARTQAVNNVDMADYSVFGEYEKKLLDDYELFGVDGAYGTGEFSESKLEERMKTYLDLNAVPSAEGLSSLCFDPWQLSVDECRVTEYALLSDDGGENFYQQAVSYVRTTALTGLVGQLYQYYSDANDLEKQQTEYEQDKKASDENMETASSQEEVRRQELLEEEEETGISLVPDTVPENPLPRLAAVITRGLLRNVCGDQEISGAAISGSDLQSHRKKAKGTLELEEKYGGLIDDLLFREYLLGVFPCYTEQKESTQLKYQLEYIIAGKKSDKANLKSVANRLLLLREGANYVWLLEHPEVGGAAETLAWLILGWTGMPGLVEVLHHGLLLGWAYGESLMDVRTLLAGHKVPLVKDISTWSLSLDKLSSIGELLDAGGSEGASGLRYQDYLRILLNLESVEKQKSRGLDLVELNMKQEDGLSDFQADHIVVAFKNETSWSIPSVFSKVTSVFAGIAGGPWSVTVKGSFAYDY